MTKSLLSELETYKEKVSQLDERAEKLAEDKKHQYEITKTQFLSRIDVWKNSVESDIAQLRRNIEEGYYELESKIM